MKQQQLIRVIQAPVISEKSTILVEQQKRYVFKVKKTANKKNIRQAVEVMFNVQVESINILNVKGKKKAYVKLKPGFDIDLSVA